MIDLLSAIGVSIAVLVILVGVPVLLLTLIGWLTGWWTFT